MNGELEVAEAIAIEHGWASTSLLQRRMRIGFAHALSIMNELSARGVVEPAQGVKARMTLDTR